MAIRLSAEGMLELEGTCPGEDAEILLQHLLEAPGTKVDLRGCENAHTAVIQVLMAAKPELLGPAAAQEFEKWVRPVLVKDPQ